MNGKHQFSSILLPAEMMNKIKISLSLIYWHLIERCYVFLAAAAIQSIFPLKNKIRKKIIKRVEWINLLVLTIFEIKTTLYEKRLNYIFSNGGPL